MITSPFFAPNIFEHLRDGKIIVLMTKWLEFKILWLKISKMQAFQEFGGFLKISVAPCTLELQYEGDIGNLFLYSNKENYA